ncbi:MAG: glycosyltransferase family 9 protein [Ferruginibacter sp.]
MPKILVIRFSSIGDIVLTTPVFRCIKKQIPGVELHFVTKLSYKIVTATNPYIDTFFYLDNDLPELIEKLKKENYDHVIDLHNNARSLRIKRALKKRASSIRKLNVEKFLLTNLNINIMPDAHITQRSLDTAAPLGIKDDGMGLDYFIPGKDIVNDSDIPTSHSAGFISLVIGATYETKKMPVHKLQELCYKIDHPVILLGGKDDFIAAEMIASVDPIKIYNACGKFNLNESADLVRQSKLVISHDTGLMHIAAALQKPIISIWGNTSPVLGMYPYYGSRSTLQYDNIEVRGLRCRPCSKIGYHKCPLEHFKCMENQDIDMLVRVIQQRLCK